MAVLWMALFCSTNEPPPVPLDDKTSKESFSENYLTPWQPMRCSLGSSSQSCDVFNKWPNNLTVFGHSGNWIVIQSDTMLRPKCRGQVAATVFRQDRLQNVKTLRTAFCQSANRYTRLENLAWSHPFFWQLVFCRKRRFTKPLLLSRVDTFCSFT